MSGEFEAAAPKALADARLRRNLNRATTTIRAKTSTAIVELEDWEALRTAGAEIKERALRHLDVHLERLERSVAGAGGTVHWARDAEEANAIVTGIARRSGAHEAIKAKSMATDEIGLNQALEAEGVTTIETDLAELIVQLAEDRPSHILVPAIHRSRREIRDLFRERLGEPNLGEDPVELTAAARRYLRARFLAGTLGISGANFAVAETGTVVVVESEGNARMCTTLPETLVTVMGIEKVLPQFSDLGVMLRLLPRSATGERMNPYTSLWTGVTEGDGPRDFHLVLLDNGRTLTLADQVGRQALRCIRCSACLNICPVYERTGGHAYGSVYPGPIGAILAPQLSGLKQHTSLPWASSLCGACYEVCPVKIDIPTVLVHLRSRIVGEQGAPGAERAAMAAAGNVLASRRLYEASQWLGRAMARPFRRRGGIRLRRPRALGAWTRSRDLPPPPGQSFRDWWRSR